jgi:pimeloyl-ACP methyl ester carboxylesterase
MQTNPPALSDTIPPLKMLETPQGRQIAYRHRPGAGPLIVYLHGYASDMMATKAQFFDQRCAARGQGFLRFDCSGNGESSGDISEGTIGHWIEDALAVIDLVADGPVILVGSSMGGWTGLHSALKRPDKVKALIGIAAAPDFTKSILDGMTEEEKPLYHQRGYYELPTSLENPLRIYKGLLEESPAHFLLEQPITLDIPVVLMQGKLDQEVPWKTAERIKAAVTPALAEIVYIEDGDHRLARIDDMLKIDSVIERLSKQV